MKELFSATGIYLNREQQNPRINRLSARFFHKYSSKHNSIQNKASINHINKDPSLLPALKLRSVNHNVKSKNPHKYKTFPKRYPLTFFFLARINNYHFNLHSKRLRQRKLRIKPVLVDLHFYERINRYRKKVYMDSLMITVFRRLRNGTNINDFSQKNRRLTQTTSLGLAEIKIQAE